MPKSIRQFAIGHINTGTAGEKTTALLRQRRQEYASSHGRPAHNHRRLQLDIRPQGKCIVCFFSCLVACLALANVTYLLLLLFYTGHRSNELLCRVRWPRWHRCGRVQRLAFALRTCSQRTLPECTGKSSTRSFRQHRQKVPGEIGETGEFGVAIRQIGAAAPMRARPPFKSNLMCVIVSIGPL